MAGYNSANFAGSTTVANKALVADGASFSVTGVDQVVGTAGNDYIATSNTGMTVTAGAGTTRIVGEGAADTFIMAANLTVADFIDGGAGTDTLTVTVDNTTTDLNNVTNVENLTLGAAAEFLYTTVDGLIASGATLTVNADLVTGANNVTFNATAETDGTLVFTNTGAGTGVHTITGGALADTITVGTGATNVLKGLGGNDTITGSSVVDTITGGTGADVINISAGGADVLNYAILDTAVAVPFAAAAAKAVFAASQTTVGMDVITGFAVGDKIQVVGAGTSSATLLNESTANLGAATVGDFILMQGTYDATANTFIGDGTGTSSMLVYDTNGTTAGGTYEGIVLVGYVDAGTGDSISTAGLFTGVA